MDIQILNIKFYLFVSLRLKAGIPSEIARAPRWNDGPIGPTLEDVNLFSVRVPEHAKSVTSFVLSFKKEQKLVTILEKWICP